MDITLTVKHQEFFPGNVELDTETFRKREAARARPYQELYSE